jgi:RHS repeat-associated protein
MSQAKPDDPVNRSAPRVVLLATDRSQSIIGEIVDGQTKTIAYSAYGEQSAQQKVETRLGFNGQLREADIGWYLLGNGYRAYNPRLMRFHSPDSWSPFRGGGLNAYMYCVGDPVNRVDPTGHAYFPWLPLQFRKFVSRVDRFLFGGAEHTGGKGIAINTGFSEMRPEKTGEGNALASAAGAVAVGAPIVKPKGLYPGGDLAPQEVTWGQDTHFAGLPPAGRKASTSRRPKVSDQQSTTTHRPEDTRRASIWSEKFVYEGPFLPEPRIEHMTLLGGAPSTANTRLVSRTSVSASNPTLIQYRATGDNPTGNGWRTWDGPGGYQNMQVRGQRQRDPVLNNPNEPGPSSRIRRDR